MAKILLNKKTLLNQAHGQKRRRSARRLLVFVIVLFFLMLGGILALYHPALRINNILADGAEVVRDEEIKLAAEGYFKKKIYYVIPRDNIFFYNQNEFEVAILSAIPRLLSAEPVIDNLNTIRLKVEESRPAALWCSDDSVTKKCYFLDDQGRIFARAPVFSPGVFMVFKGDQIQEPLDKYPLGDMFPRLLTFMTEVKNIFDRMKMDVQIDSLEITQNEDYVVTINNELNNGTWQILIGQEGSPNELILNLETVLEAPVFKDQWVAKSERLLSIDLRFGKKVFYKFE